MRRLFLPLVATVCLNLTFMTVAQADHIDSFEAGDFSVSTSSTASSTQLDAASAQGGIRTVDVFSSGGGIASTWLATSSTADDSVTFATDSNTTGFFQYGYGSYSTAGDLDLDILNINASAQWTHLSISYIGSTTGTTTVTLNDGTSVSSVTDTFNPGSSTLQFDYQDFISNSVGGPIDLSDIDGIQLSVVLNNANNPSSLSYSIFKRDGFQAVPEPSAAGLGILVVAGVLRFRRSRKKPVAK